MKKNSLFLVFSALFILFLGSGCNNIAVYSGQGSTPPIGRLANTTGNKKVAVLPYADLREYKYSDPAQSALACEFPSGDRGSLYWGLLPLLPAGHAATSYPGRSEHFISISRYFFNPAQDLTNNTASTLIQAGLFGQISRAASIDEARALGADYVWEGALETAYYDGYLITYGVTYIAAPVFWLLGAPYGVSYNTLQAKFRLIDCRSGECVWEETVSQEDSLVQWIYSGYGQDVSMFQPLFQQSLNSALVKMSQNPDIEF